MPRGESVHLRVVLRRATGLGGQDVGQVARGCIAFAICRSSTRETSRSRSRRGPVTRLLGSPYRLGGERPLREEDVIVVAPYNAHVRRSPRNAFWWSRRGATWRNSRANRPRSSSTPWPRPSLELTFHGGSTSHGTPDPRDLARSVPRVLGLLAALARRELQASLAADADGELALSICPGRRRSERTRVSEPRQSTVEG